MYARRRRHRVRPWSTGLISIDASGPTTDDVPPDARLGDASHLQALHDPTPRLDLAPRHVLQQDRPAALRETLGRAARAGGGAVLVHVVFAAGLFYLLSFRDAERPREVETPIDVVVEPAKPPAPKPTAAKGVEPAPTSAKAAPPDRLKQALAPPVAPDPNPPAPPRVQAPPSNPPPQPAAPEPKPEQPKLVAPPPEPARAATQDHDPKPANLVPERDEVDAATHEAKPAETPEVLTTADAGASFAVPVPVRPAAAPAEKPTAPIPAKEPSATEKLAAALPLDTSAMPMSFRSVLAGNGAQVSAAYKGLVFGRFNRHPEIGERARRQHLKGQVIVGFTIDDAGRIDRIAVVQSSGNAAVDALGLELIRSAAPFPPPPPEAQRSFTPALAFGE